MSSSMCCFLSSIGVGPDEIQRIASKYIELDDEDRLKLRMDLRPIDKEFFYRKAQYLLFGQGASSFNGLS